MLLVGLLPLNGLGKRCPLQELVRDLQSHVDLVQPKGVNLPEIDDTKCIEPSLLESISCLSVHLALRRLAPRQYRLAPRSIENLRSHRNVDRPLWHCHIDEVGDRLWQVSRLKVPTLKDVDYEIADVPTHRPPVSTALCRASPLSCQAVAVGAFSFQMPPSMTLVPSRLL